MKKKFKIIFLATIIFLCVIGSGVFWIIKKQEKKFLLNFDVPTSYTLFLTVKNKLTDVLYEINIDTIEHDAHICDVNYEYSNSRYYRFLKKDKTIIYYILKCKDGYNNEGKCEKSEWQKYPISFSSEEEIEKKDISNIYNEIKKIIEKNKLPEKQNLILELDDFEKILNYIKYMDDSIDLDITKKYKINYLIENNFISKVSFQDIGNSKNYFTIQFENFNKFKETIDMYYFISR